MGVRFINPTTMDSSNMLSALDAFTSSGIVFSTEQRLYLANSLTFYWSSRIIGSVDWSFGVRFKESRKIISSFKVTETAILHISHKHCTPSIVLIGACWRWPKGPTTRTRSRFEVDLSAIPVPRFMSKNQCQKDKILRRIPTTSYFLRKYAYLQLSRPSQMKQ